MPTTINTANALGAKVLKYLPLNGTEGEIVSGTALTLGAGGSYVSDATYGMTLRGNGSQAVASVPLDLSAVSQITLAFRMKWDAYGSGDNMAMEFTPNLNDNPGFYVDPNAGTDFQIGCSQGVSRSFTRPTAGAYHYYIITIDRINTLVTFNVDNVEIAQTAGFGQGSTGNFANNILYLFSRANSALFGAGNLQKLAIFNGLLSSAEKTSLFNNPDQIATVQADTAPTVAAPAIIGTPQVGVASGYTPGAVTGSPTPTVTQQWTLDGVDISGATGATYTPVSGDATHALRVRQIATNSAGTVNATSAPGTIAAPTPDTTAPTLVSAVSSTDGNSITLGFTEPLAQSAYPQLAFSVSGRTVGSVTGSGSNVVLSALNPKLYVGNTATVGYVKPGQDALKDAAGNEVAAFNGFAVTNNSTAVVPANPPPISSVINIKTAGAGWDFPTVAALDAYIASLDCVALGKLTVIYVYDNMDVSGRMFAPATHNDSNYVVMYPAIGQGVNDGTTNDAGNYGTTGVMLTMNDTFTVGFGMSVQGFRCRGTGANTMLQFNPGRSPGKNAEFKYNRVWLTASGQAMFSSQYNALCHCHDNYFLFDGSATGNLWNTYGQIDAQRNTFVRKNGGAGTGNLVQGANNTFRDNVVIGFGADVLNGVGNFANRANNYVDSVQTTPDAALIYGSTASLVISVDDVRPAIGSPLIGGGSSTSVSTNDVKGDNRGVTPDAGAFQKTAAMPLPTGTVTEQRMDGASLIISGTTTNNPTSGKITLSPANPGNGAVSVGPVDLVLGTNVFSVSANDLNDLAPGNYIVTGTLTNAGGTTLIQGSSAFEIVGMGNLVYDGGGTGQSDPVIPGAAPTISIATADANILTGKTATISGAVNLQADGAGHVDVFLDPQPSGAAVALGAAPVASSTWTKQAVVAPGLYRLRVVATANGQTATASTATVRILGLTGTVGIPVA